MRNKFHEKNGRNKLNFEIWQERYTIKQKYYEVWESTAHEMSHKFINMLCDDICTAAQLCSSLNDQVKLYPKYS